LLNRLTLSFVILFTCFNAGSTLINSIYDKRGLKSYGQVNNMVLYISFFISTLICNLLMQKFNKSNTSLKKIMAFSVLCYLYYLLTHAFSCYCTTMTSEIGSVGKDPSLICSKFSLLLINIFGSFVIGFFGATMLWAC
jgi:hypothetical protein